MKEKLKDLRPDLEKEWHPTKNSLLFEEITARNPNQVWWKCEKGHEWKAIVYSRSRNGDKCPVCANKIILSGFNDLKTLNPTLATEWHPTKNGKITPDTVGVNSTIIKPWWLGKCGHEWQARIASRYSFNTDCPYCTNRLLLSGFNDLDTVNPALAAQWHPTKNGELKPTQIHVGSNAKAWWQCEKGHSFFTRVNLRSRKNSQCPECKTGKPQVVTEIKNEPKIAKNISKFKTTNVENSFATLYPDQAKLWHPTKNENLNPNSVAPFSNNKVWWQCEKGHEWETIVANITRNKGCPVCSGKLFISGVNDIATLYPQLASEWNIKKNSLPSSKVLAGTNHKAYWVCKLGHEWESKINARMGGSGCPTCSNRVVLKGFNDISSQYPGESKLWHPTKNGELKPTQIVSGSGQKVWWQCKKGHSYKTSPYNKIFGHSGCLKCYPQISKTETEIFTFIKSLGFQNIEQSNRTVLNGKELDIYVPEKNFAIEYNGIYWHTEKAGKGETYHYDKWKACKDQGIQLMQIWEDDWNNNSDLIKRMLQVKLQKGDTNGKIFARKLTHINLTNAQAKNFMLTNHLQGFRSGSKYLGLKTKTNELVAVIIVTYQKNNTIVDITRFATSKHIIGGFSKLLKQAITTSPQTVKTIYSYSDNTISVGNVYKVNRFTQVNEGKPSYSYVVNGKRVHRLNYTKKRFQTDPLLTYVNGLTEKQLAELNNLERVWDAGSTRWMKTV